LQFGGFIDGFCYLTGDLRLPELLLQTGTAQFAEAETVSGSLCHLVTDRNPYGSFKLWIDLDSFVLRQFEYEKQAGDLVEEGRKLGEPAPGVKPEDITSHWKMLCRDTEFAMAGDKPVCVAARLDYEITQVNGDKERQELYATRSEIDLAPDFRGTDAFRIDLPNGVPITDKDNPDAGVRYQWKEGDVVPAYADLVDTPRASFAHSPWRGAIWAVNAVVFIAAGCYGLFRTRRR
jgi:hypothetical protein